MNVRIATLSALTLALPVLAPAQTTNARNDGAPRMTLETFQTLRAAGKIVVVDVRATSAYERGHIPGAWSVPVGHEEANLARLRAAHKPLVLYCG